MSFANHPHDETLPDLSDGERVRFEEGLLRLTAAGRIENLLDDLGLTQKELADRLGKSQAWVSKVISGRQNLTLSSLARIGFVLGVRWNPELVRARSEGSIAENDPPLPSWVHTENGIVFDEPAYLGSVASHVGALASFMTLARTTKSVAPTFRRLTHSADAGSDEVFAVELVSHWTQIGHDTVEPGDRLEFRLGGTRIGT